MTHQNGHDLIPMAADYAYRQAVGQGFVPEATADSIHRHQVCGTVSSLMLEYLSNYGYPDAVRVGRQGNIAQSIHSYVLLDADQGADVSGGLVIDGTWQQFFTDRLLPPDAPRVLVGSRAEVVAYLGTLGAPEGLKDIYRPIHRAGSVTKEEIYPPRH